MSYDRIDSIINEWARNHDLYIANTYQDSEVRSTCVVGKDSNKRCQIWIDPIDENDSTAVHVWDYHSLKKDFRATVSTLSEVLESTYELALAWL